MTKEQEEALLKKRIVPVMGRIEKGIVADFEKMLFQLAFDKPTEPVHIIIDSGGGSVFPALTVHDLIKGMPFETIATVVGDCNSAALIIIAACKKRRATPTSRFLFHAMRTEDTIFSTEDLDRQVLETTKRLRTLFEQGLHIQSKSFGIPKEDLQSMMIEGEKFNIKLTAEEAKNKGVIHEIVESFDFLSPSKI